MTPPAEMTGQGAGTPCGAVIGGGVIGTAMNEAATRPCFLMPSFSVLNRPNTALIILDHFAMFDGVGDQSLALSML